MVDGRRRGRGGGRGGILRRGGMRAQRHDGYGHRGEDAFRMFTPIRHRNPYR
jgi:hypothetical protein